jgi:hypothetical protein
MSKPRRNTSSVLPDDTLYTGKRRKPIPHEFVLDAIAALLPYTRPIRSTKECNEDFDRSPRLLHKTRGDLALWTLDRESRVGGRLAFP